MPYLQLPLPYSWGLFLCLLLRPYAVFLMNSASDKSAALWRFFDGEEGKARYMALVMYAAKQLDRLRHASRVVPDSPLDYVHKTIARSVPNAEGRVARPLPDDMSLEACLRMNIRSVISHHLFPGVERQNSQGSFGTKARENERLPRDADDFSGSMWKDETVEGEVREATFQSIDDQLVLRQFLEFIQGDEIVRGMVKLLLDEGIDSPVELIAERLGVSSTDVNNAKKRQIRLLRNFNMGKGTL